MNSNVASAGALTKVAWRFASPDFKAVPNGEGTVRRMSIARGLIVNYHKAKKNKLTFKDVRKLLKLEKLPEKYVETYDPTMHLSKPALNPVITEEQARRMLT